MSSLVKVLNNSIIKIKSINSESSPIIIGSSDYLVYRLKVLENDTMFELILEENEEEFYINEEGYIWNDQAIYADNTQERFRYKTLKSIIENSYEDSTIVLENAVYEVCEPIEASKNFTLVIPNDSSNLVFTYGAGYYLNLINMHEHVLNIIQESNDSTSYIKFNGSSKMHDDYITGISNYAKFQFNNVEFNNFNIVGLLSQTPTYTGNLNITFNRCKFIQVTKEISNYYGKIQFNSCYFDALSKNTIGGNTEYIYNNCVFDSDLLEIQTPNIIFSNNTLHKIKGQILKFVNNTIIGAS
jgi:hypothetical protein